MANRLVATAATLGAAVGLVGVVIGADVYARSEMEAVAREVVAGALGLDDPARVDAKIDGGSALLQLILGNVGHVDVAVEDVKVGEVSGDFHADIYGLPTNQVQPIGRVIAYIELDPMAVDGLARQFVTSPVSGVDLAPPSIVLETTMGEGSNLPVSVYLDPVMRGGDIILVPALFSLRGQELTPQEFEAAMDVQASSFVEPSGLCVDNAVPDAMSVVDVRVSRGAVTVVLDASQLTVPELAGAHGTCAA